ncbi:MAG: copper resistance protein CopC [Chloroflexota bacterium]
MKAPIRFRLAPAAIVLLWLALPSTASAHASFVRSDPADVCGPLAQPRVQPSDPRCQTGLVLEQSPSAVRITFSEQVQLLGRGIRVLSPSGKPVQQGKPLANGDQASVDVDASELGTYVVDWQVASEDTHPARGQFAFSVGHPSQPAAVSGANVGQVEPLGLALQALGRWLHFAGYALAFGTLAVSLLLARGTLVNGPGLWRMTNAGILLLLLAEPLALLGQTGSLGLDQMLDGDTLGDALASPFGRLLGFRIAAALLLWVVSGSASPAVEAMSTLGNSDWYEQAANHPSLNRHLAVAAAIALGLALAIIDGLGQHAASFRPEWLGLIVHAGHLIGMALWIGALAVLLWAWRQGKPLAAVTKVAVAAFALVAATGLAMALVHFPQPSDVLATAYGQVLGGKQILLLAAGGLALLARKRGTARRAELGALTLLIGLAGLLVSLPPPR